MSMDVLQAQLAKIAEQAQGCLSEVAVLTARLGELQRRLAGLEASRAEDEKRIRELEGSSGSTALHSKIIIGVITAVGTTACGLVAFLLQRTLE